MTDVGACCAAAIRAIPDGPPETIATAARALLLDDDWIAGLIAANAATLRSDPLAALPMRGVNNDVRSGVVIHEDERLTVTLDIAHAARLAAKKNRPRIGSIAFSGRISVIRFAKAGGATLSLWEAPPIGLDFNAAEAGICRAAGRRTVTDNEVVTIDGRRESFIVEAARSNLLLVQATVRTEAPVSTEYDAGTGAYLGCSATDDRDSRLQLISTLARLLGAPEAFPAIAALLDHPSFFVRWHAMREMIGIDAEAALPYLKLLATHDPHRDVREAALATLGLFAPAARKAA
jgi:hypothetical protein